MHFLPMSPACVPAKTRRSTGQGIMIDEEDTVPYFDGVELHRQKTLGPVKTPLFPLVNLALGSGWPTDKTPNPSSLYVDYVKVW